MTAGALAARERASAKRSSVARSGRSIAATTPGQWRSPSRPSSQKPLSSADGVAVDERLRLRLPRPRALQLAEAQQHPEVPAGAVQPGAQQARRHEVPGAGALAVEQRPADPAGQRHAGDVVAEAAPDRRRQLPAGHDRRGERRAGPERADVVPGPMGVRAVEAVAGDDPVDQRRVALADRGRVEPEALQGGDADVRHEHVGAGEQALHRLAAGVGPQVEHDAALAAVVELERRHRALVADADGAEDRPLRIAGRRLDLDDVGAPVGQHAGRRRTRHPGGQLDHADTVEDHGPTLGAVRTGLATDLRSRHEGRPAGNGRARRRRFALAADAASPSSSARPGRPSTSPAARPVSSARRWTARRPSRRPPSSSTPPAATASPSRATTSTSSRCAPSSPASSATTAPCTCS